MSNKIDDRIVNMKFNNAQFESGISETMGSLSGLSEALKMDGIGDNVSKIASKFSAFGAIGLTAIVALTNAAIGAGQSMAAALIDPIVEGGKKRALNIEQAKFQFKGLGMDVEQSMADALFAVKDTAFGLDEAAVAAAQFGASGIKSGEEMQTALRGISGVAAMSGSSYTDMANVFTKVAGQGRLMGDDLNRLGTRGINAAATLGEAMGKTEAEVREMVTKGEIDFKTFAAAMSSAFGEHATKASETFTGAMANMRAALARIGADFATVNFESLRQIFVALTPAIDNIKTALKPVLDLFTDLTKIKTDVIVGILNALNMQDIPDQPPPFFRALANVLGAITDVARTVYKAMSEIFPATTGGDVARMAQSFEAFSKKLIPSEETLAKIGRAAKGFFAVLDIGWMILQQVIGLFGDLLGAIVPVGGGILDMSAGLGDWLVALRDSIKDGTVLGDVFKYIGDKGKAVIQFIKDAAGSIGDTLGIDSFAAAWTGLKDALKAVWEFLQPFFKWVGEAFVNVKDAIKGGFEAMNFEVFIGLLNVGALAGVVILVKGFIDKIKAFFSGGDIFGGMKQMIKDVFGEVTNTFKAMQDQLKAGALTKIAIAIGILVASVIALSFVDTAQLFISLGAMATMMIMLMGMVTVMDKVSKTMNPAKMSGIAIAMGLLAGAMLILSTAILILSTIEWEGLAIGLLALAGGMAVLVGASMLLDKVGPKLAITAGGLILMATAVVILAGGLKILASLSWDDIGRSLTGLGVTMGILVATMKIAGSSAQGAVAMFIISSALTVLGAALIVMAKLDWDELTRALVTLGGSLLIMAIGVNAMQGSIAGAAAMLIVSVGITILAQAFLQFAKLSWDDIGRVLVVLAGGLLILAGAMALMGIPIVLLGAVGILAASAAMMMLAPALILLGTMSWDAIGRGLTVLAGALVIMAAGGLLLIPAIPAFLGLGIAIALIGVGAMAAGIGILAFSIGFTALAASAAVGAQGIKMALEVLIGLIPAAMASFAQGIIDFALVIANGGVEFTAAMITLLTSLIEAIAEVGPLVIDTLWDLLMQMASKLEENVPILVEKGGNLIIGVLNGMESKVPGIALAGTNLMIALMRAIANEVPRLADEGAKAIIKLVNGVATAVDNNAAAMGAAGGRLAAAIVRGMVNGIFAGIGEIVGAAQSMANRALNAAKSALGINSPSKEFMKIGMGVDEGMEQGIDNYAHLVDNAAKKMADSALASTKQSLRNISSTVAEDLSMTPTIRPVLDLSGIKKDASMVNGLFNAPKLDLKSSVAYASEAQATGYAAQNSIDRVELQRWAAAQKGDVYFNQTNNSPKALSDGEIYRKTKNQLSVAKEELTTSNAK